MVRVKAPNSGVSLLPPNSNKGVAVDPVGKSSIHSPFAFAIFETAEAEFFGEFDAYLVKVTVPEGFGEFGTN